MNKAAFLISPSTAAYQAARAEESRPRVKEAATNRPPATAFLVSPHLNFYKEAGGKSQLFRRGMVGLRRGFNFGRQGGQRALDAANRTVSKLGPKSMNLSTSGQGELRGALQTQHALRNPGQGFMGAVGRAAGGLARSPIRKGLMSRGVMLPVAAGLGYGRGYGSGVNEGVAQTMNQFEQMPWYQHLAYGLPNFFGHREAMGDYALNKAQDNLPLIARLMGVDFTGSVQNKMNDYREARPTMWDRFQTWRNSAPQ